MALALYSQLYHLLASTSLEEFTISCTWVRDGKRNKTGVLCTKIMHGTSINSELETTVPYMVPGPALRGFSEDTLGHKDTWKTSRL